MKKRVNVTFSSGSLKHGFDAVVRVFEIENNQNNSSQISGKLPGTSEISVFLTAWQQDFEKKVINAAEIREGDSQHRIIPRQNREFNINNSAQELTDAITSWLDVDYQEWRKIVNFLQQNLSKEDTVEVIIETQNPQLRQLPWQEWNLFKESYTKAEIALSPTEYEYPDSNFRPGEEVRILAVLGKSDDIDTKFDRQELDSIQERGAKIQFLEQPTKRELIEQIKDEQGWHIFFFAGHSNSDEDGELGWLQINQDETLEIKELKNTLRTAIGRGLQIAIFNSCDGVGLANQLAKLNLPQSIVMRKSIPDNVAKDFLQSFLSSFSQNQSFYLSVREARGHIEDIWSSEYPGISWLPIICQNPAVKPLSWMELGGGKQAKVSPNLSAQSADVATDIIFDVPPLIDWNFTGREGKLKELTDLLIKSQEQRKSNIVGLCGTGGIGKSALACHFGRLHKQDFPDGVIYQRVDNKKLIDIAKEFASHYPVRIDLDDKPFHIMRKVFKKRRALLIFDNAETSDIQELRPDRDDEYCVIVTARDRGLFPPIGINRFEQIPLSPLSHADALILLGKFLDEDFLEKNKSAANEIIDLVDRLPLALRIIGMNLQVNPVGTLHEYALKLRNEKKRLENLKFDKLDVRACFNLSLEQLRKDNKPEIVDFFSCLSVCHKDGFTKYAARAASKFDKLNSTASKFDKLNLVQEQLEYLDRFSLLNKKNKSEYVFHPLIHIFAQEELAKQPLEEQEAKKRFALFYKNEAKYNKFKDPSILSIELKQIMQVLKWMQREGMDDFDFIRKLMHFFEDNGHWREAVETTKGFIPIAEQFFNWEQAIHLRIQQAKFLHKLGEDKQAEQVLIPIENLLPEIYEQKECLRCEAMWRTTRAVVLQELGRFNEALEDIKRSTDIEEDIGELGNLSKVLITQAGVLKKQGKYNEAIEILRDCVQIEEKIGDSIEIAIARTRLGSALSKKGGKKCWLEAIQVLMRALDLEERDGTPKGKTFVLNVLGTVHSQMGEYEKAIEYLEESITIKERIHDHDGLTKSLNSLSEVKYKQGNIHKAMEYLHRSAEIREQFDKENTSDEFIKILRRVLTAFKNRGKRGDALAHCQKIIARIPTNQRLLQLYQELETNR